MIAHSKSIGLMIVFTLIVQASAGAQELRRLSLDDAGSLGLRIEPDVVVKAEGMGSVKIITAWPTTICLGEFTALDVGKAILVCKAKAKSELEGEAFLEMWAHVGGGQYFSKGMDNPIKGKSDWKTLQTPFLLQEGQVAEKVTVNIVINGKGTLWMDDIVLSKKPLE